MIQAVNVIFKIIISWGVRLLSSWLATHFGQSLTEDQQAGIINTATASILVACVALVEFVERVLWPKIKARIGI